MLIVDVFMYSDFLLAVTCEQLLGWRNQNYLPEISFMLSSCHEEEAYEAILLSSERFTAPHPPCYPVLFA